MPLHRPHHRTPRRTRRGVSCAAGLTLLTVLGAACSSDQPAAPAAVSVAAPAPGGSDVARCPALLAALPATLSSSAGVLQRRAVTGPGAVLAVAWGEPAVVLECGVAPAALSAEVLRLGPDDDTLVTFEPDDVGAATAFTTGELRPDVRVTVPDRYDSTLLVDLAPVLRSGGTRSG